MSDFDFDKDLVLDVRGDNAEVDALGIFLGLRQMTLKIQSESTSMKWNIMLILAKSFVGSR